MNIDDQLNAPLAGPRLRQPFRTPAKKHQSNLVADEDRKKAMTQLKDALENTDALPDINLDEKKKILNSIGLKKINKLRNV